MRSGFADVVGVLCLIDEIVGFKVPQAAVKAGGYGSVQEALDDVVPRIEKIWLKRAGGKK